MTKYEEMTFCYCKDCKHWDRMNTSDEGGCYRDPLAEGVDWTRADDYCSYGERKEG